MTPARHRPDALHARHPTRRRYRDRLWHASPAAVCVRPARYANLRLEDAVADRDMRRASMRPVCDVAGGRQRPLRDARSCVQGLAGARLMGQPKLPLTYKRRMQTERVLRAGCHVCHGDTAYWTAANAQALAAQHHDRTTHATWVEIVMTTQYGRIAADPRQIDIEDAIASARGAS